MLFFETALKYLDEGEEHLAPLTVHTYFWNLKKINDFRPDLKCSDINEIFVKDYRIHLQKQGNKPNTIAKDSPMGKLLDIQKEPLHGEALLIY